MFTFNYRINDIQEEVVISLMFKKIKVWSKTFDLSEFNEADFFDILYDDIIDEIISCDDDNQYQIYMKRENEIKKKLYDCLKKINKQINDTSYGDFTKFNDCLKEINKQINDTLHGDSKKNSSFVQSNYAYARYAIIKCFDKIKLGVKQLPKTINMIDMVEGNKCYAQIVFITTADKLDDYKTLEYEQIIGFKDITEKLFLCLGIKDIKKSNDTKNICYYYCKKMIKIQKQK